MANFPNIKPTYGAIKKNAPAVRSIKFGSGYEQRATFGINQNPKVYELQFKVTESEANTIENFLHHPFAIINGYEKSFAQKHVYA